MPALFAPDHLVYLYRLELLVQHLHHHDHRSPQFIPLEELHRSAPSMPFLLLTYTCLSTCTLSGRQPHPKRPGGAGLVGAGPFLVCAGRRLATLRQQPDGVCREAQGRSDYGSSLPQPLAQAGGVPVL